ncbi:hypothetical protein HZA44_01970 [Candidatus Peregrinibacteria bacterium]|nr:hypothetical protein [Candidatus Peregrinibacteria bacterium]
MRKNIFEYESNRQSIRLNGYDYSQNGFYYVTICTYQAQPFFGHIRNGIMCLSDIGSMAHSHWREIPRHFPNVKLDEFNVLPNHIHGIIEMGGLVGKHPSVGVQNFEPLPDGNCPRQHLYQHTLSNSLGSIVRAYKSALTLWCRKSGHSDFRWQRLFYDHIIRSDESLQHIRHYVHYNTLKHSPE